jgi:hypothetical protein
MYILTLGELGFLASLRANWSRLYLTEVQRLLRNDTPDAQTRFHSVERPCHRQGFEGAAFCGQKRLDQGDRHAT